MPKIQKYGIKFPFRVPDDDSRAIELNTTPAEEVNSEIMHIIFTPKGQRLRRPDFGTRLIQYIFNPNDSQSWEDIVAEINNAVRNRISNCSIENIQVAEGENGLDLFVRIIYSVKDGPTSTVYETIAKL